MTTSAAYTTRQQDPTSPNHTASTASYSTTSYTSASSRHTYSTGLTTPDLSITSPKFKKQNLEVLETTYEGVEHDPSSALRSVSSTSTLQPRPQSETIVHSQPGSSASALGYTATKTTRGDTSRPLPGLPPSTNMSNYYPEITPGAGTRSTGKDGEVLRGPSVRHRASQFEQAAQASSSTKRTRSTSPLRVTKIRTPSNGSPKTPEPRRPGRVPVPNTAPAQSRATYGDLGRAGPSTPSGRVSPPRLARGAGSARKMIQQWEGKPGQSSQSGPSTPAFPRSQPQARVMSREYLNSKPLPDHRLAPSPLSTPGRNYSSNLTGSPQSKSRNPYSYVNAYSPSQHLQTPQQSKSLHASPSNWSLKSSPGDKKKRGDKGPGRSPLKEILNLFGGGGAFRKKGRTRRKSASGGYELDIGEMMGSNGLPGGIVFRDRMGDQEMDGRAQPQSSASRSPVQYSQERRLTAERIVSQWGSWLTSWADLTKTTLSITYCPVFQEVQSGSMTPKRVLSGSGPIGKNTEPAIAYSTIPQPSSSTGPDVDLDMKDCVEVRSLRKEEIKGRGIPSAPDGVGTEVLEMVWSDGSRRYIGVEGVAGRLGWVSAIWDVLLACKSNIPPALPPPSPLSSPKPSSPRYSLTPLSNTNLPDDPFRLSHTSTQGGLGQADSRRPSGSQIVQASTAPPVQRIGDRWIAASVIGTNSQLGPSHDIDTPKDTPGEGDFAPATVTKSGSNPTAEELRNSVQRMFDAGPDEMPSSQGHGQGLAYLNRSSSGHSAESARKVLEWQPTAERELSIFARSNSRKSATGQTPSASPYRSNQPLATDINNAVSPGRPLTMSELGRHDKTFDADTVLSFDPNDVNPSRSASQVRRKSISDRHKPVNHLAVLEENDGSLSDGMGPGPLKAPTFLSHVTFPKAQVAGLPVAPAFSVMSKVKAFETATSPTPSQPSLSRQKSGATLRSQTSAGMAGVGAMTGGEGMSKTRTTSSVDTHDSQDGLLRTPGTQTSYALPSTSDHNSGKALIGHLDRHSRDHDVLASQIGGVQIDLKAVLSSLTSLVNGTKIDDKLDTLGMDIKAIENALNLNSLSTARLNSITSPEDADPQIPGGISQVHDKLDAIAKLCEEVLAKDKARATENGKAPASPGPQGKLGIMVDADEQKGAGQEVAQIMAELTGSSNKASPRLANLQVLHHVASNPSSPRGSASNSPVISQQSQSSPVTADGPLSDETKKQVGEVLGLVKELKEARTLQTQQTTDIARYLNELNTWLEKFVHNSTNEISSMSKRLTLIVGADDDPDNPKDPNMPITMPDLVADMHSMVTEQKRKTEADGAVGARLDALLAMMGQEQERHQGQAGMMDQVINILDRQRADNEMLLRALATDLTTEIRGERLRFVEAMQQATTMNITKHVEEFKKLLSTEVHKSMKELGEMREERKALEHQISDLFALKAKFGGPSKGGPGTPPQRPTSGLAPGPYSAMRGLPVAPAGGPSPVRR